VRPPGREEGFRAIEGSACGPLQWRMGLAAPPQSGQLREKMSPFRLRAHLCEQGRITFA